MAYLSTGGCEPDLTPIQFHERSLAYFEQCKEDKEPLTTSGLILALGFASRQSLYDYSKREGYEEVVNRAKMVVEHGYELKLHGVAVTGAIFALKNFKGWSDKQEYEITEKVIDTGENEW